MRRARASALLAALIGGLLGGGCGGFTYADKQCPTCTIVEAHRSAPLTLRPQTRRLFVLVPGLLGFGWEWDKPIARLRQAPQTDFVVFWWTPFASLSKAGAEMHTVLRRLLELHAVDELVVVAHSVGGMVAVEGLRDLELPTGKRVTIATIGTPFGGMGIGPRVGGSPRRTPLVLSLSSYFDRYPAPPPGVTITAYVTSYPADPVMQPRGGHQPAGPATDPPGTRRIAVDPRADHNQIVDFVVGELLGPVSVRERTVK